MTDHPTDSARPSGSPPERGGGAVLSRALSRARWSIFWERLWPALAGIATVIGLFLAVSWLGLWLWLPPIGRADRSRRVLPVGRGGVRAVADAARADCPGGVATARSQQRPAASTGDRHRGRNRGTDRGRLCDGDLARTCRCARWAQLRRSRPAGRCRASRRAIRMRCARSWACWWWRPSLRPAVTVSTRIAAAFDWHGVVTPSNFRIDAWVSPPTYTGKPPVILPGLRTGEPVPTMTAMSVPAGSTLVIRATGQVDLDVAATGGLEVPKDGAQQIIERHRGAPVRHQRRGLRFGARRRFERRDLAVHAIPDKPPTIALAKDPEGQARGSLHAQLQTGRRLRGGRRPGPVPAVAEREAPTASRRARYLTRPRSHWHCRRRAPAPVSARPSRT